MGLCALACVRGPVVEDTGAETQVPTGAIHPGVDAVMEVGHAGVLLLPAIYEAVLEQGRDQGQTEVRVEGVADACPEADTAAAPCAGGWAAWSGGAVGQDVFLDARYADFTADPDGLEMPRAEWPDQTWSGSLQLMGPWLYGGSHQADVQALLAGTGGLDHLAPPEFPPRPTCTAELVGIVTFAPGADGSVATGQVTFTGGVAGTCEGGDRYRCAWEQIRIDDGDPAALASGCTW